MCRHRERPDSIHIIKLNYFYSLHAETYRTNYMILWLQFSNIMKCLKACSGHSKCYSTISNHDTSRNTDLISSSKIIYVLGWNFIWNEGLFSIRYVNKCHNGNFVYWLSTHTHTLNSIWVLEVSFQTKLWSVSFSCVGFWAIFWLLLSSSLQFHWTI